MFLGPQNYWCNLFYAKESSERSVRNTTFSRKSWILPTLTKHLLCCSTMQNAGDIVLTTFGWWLHGQKHVWLSVILAWCPGKGGEEVWAQPSGREECKSAKASWKRRSDDWLMSLLKVWYMYSPLFAANWVTRIIFSKLLKIYRYIINIPVLEKKLLII